MKIPYMLLDFSGEVQGFNNWDMALIEDMLTGKTWKPAQGYEFKEWAADELKMPNDGAVVVVPARQNVGFEEMVNQQISSLGWCVLILVGDEERLFDLTKIKHQRMKLWLMQPTLKDKADFYIGSGYAPHFRDLTEDKEWVYEGKQLDWFFAGQVNHERRTTAVDILKKMAGREDLKGGLIESKGFTQGLSKKDYVSGMLAAKAVPCPSGIQSPDSFRVYEALEVGAVPIADDLSPVKIHKPGYWRKVFAGEDVPFKILDNYENLEGYILDVKREYPALSNKVYAWWQNYKRKMTYKLHEHVHEVSGLPYNENDIRNHITVLVVTSPIKSHPSTAIIDQCIADIRQQLPDCEVIIGMDGVRPEQEHYREQYETYQKRVLWKTNFEWQNVTAVRFEQHMHQAAMTKELLKLVNTPVILFVEHDTGLTPDFSFEWPQLIEAIESGEAYMIRFNHEAEVLPDHKHLMLGDRELVAGLPMIKTVQWSQRPHLASTAFYRDMLDRFFTEDSRTMIEDVIHGKVMVDYNDEGLMGWYKWRVWLYAPEGNIKRSYTTDGRRDDPKYEMRF